MFKFINIIHKSIPNSDNVYNLNLFEYIKFTKINTFNKIYKTYETYEVSLVTKQIYRKKLKLEYYILLNDFNILRITDVEIINGHSLFLKIVNLFKKKKYDNIDYIYSHFKLYNQINKLSNLNKKLNIKDQNATNINLSTIDELIKKDYNNILEELLIRYNPIEYEILKLS